MTSQQKHIAFFGRSTFHFSYYKTIISGLGKLDCRVTYYYDQEWSQNASDSDLREFQKNNPTWFTSEPFRILENRRSKFINIVRDLTTLASYFTIRVSRNLFRSMDKVSAQTGVSMFHTTW